MIMVLWVGSSMMTYTRKCSKAWAEIYWDNACLEVVLLFSISCFNLANVWYRDREQWCSDEVVRPHDLGALSRGFESEKSQWWWQWGHPTSIRSWTKSLCKPGNKLHNRVQGILMWNIKRSKECVVTRSLVSMLCKSNIILFLVPDTTVLVVWVRLPRLRK